MTEKSSPLPFQPAPRPQSRLSAGDAQRLAEVTADLGFTRPSGPQEAAASASSPAPAKRLPATRLAESKADGVALKFDVPSAVWTALKLEAIKRRVTVRYLVLEALSRVGYEVDLASVPEDGRRLR